MSSTRDATARALARRRPPADAPVPEPSQLASVHRPDGPSNITTLLTLLTQREQPNAVFEAAARAHRPGTHVRMAGEQVYIVSDPDLITEVFLTRSRDVMKGRGLQAARALLGNGLLTSEGEFHMRQRRLAQPAFHRTRIADYAATMVSEAQRHEATWTDGQQVDMVEQMSSLTFAIVGRTLFGTDLTGDARAFGDTLATLIDGFGRVSNIGSERLVRALPQGRRLLAMTEDLDVVVQRIIEEHRAAIAAGEQGDDLLTWLIQARDDESAAAYGVAMTDEQLRDEVMTFVLAGHETTAMALSWAWWLLSCHPAAADRMVAELRDVLGDPDATAAATSEDAGIPDAARASTGDGRGVRAPSYDDIARLPYTNAVVAETIRLYPPAWIMGRRLLTDMTIGDWDVPSGSIVLGSPWILHRDPTLWDRASSFVPERWLDGDGRFDESAPGQPRGAWIPFGFGNRRCIGEQFAWTEAVLLLATLAPHWRPELVPGSVVETRAAVTLRPRHGLPMTLRAR